MILFYSGAGGSRNFIPETILKEAPIMLSFHVNMPNGKPDQRFKGIIKAKKKKAKKHGKGKT